MEAVAIAKVLSGLLIIIRSVSGQFGFTRAKLADLLATVVSEERDVTDAEVQALLDDAYAKLDDLDAAIARAESEGEFRE